MDAHWDSLPLAARVSHWLFPSIESMLGQQVARAPHQVPPSGSGVTPASRVEVPASGGGRPQADAQFCCAQDSTALMALLQDEVALLPQFVTQLELLPQPQTQALYEAHAD
jgi:hypothetical protein